MHYTFDVVGIYNGLFVMADRQTGSVWTHYDGSVLSGPLANQGIRLSIVPILQTSWVDWMQQHPDTTVLDRYAEFADRYRAFEPGRAGLGGDFQKSLLHQDDRLPENELVVGAGIGDQFRAYVLSDFGPGIHVAADILADIPVVLFVNPDNTFGLVYAPRIGATLLQLRVDNGAIVDERGNVWNTSGQAISGPDQGAQLPYVTSFVSEWYGWAAYHPQTSIFGR